MTTYHAQMDASTEPARFIPAIAGFWRRFAAWVVDVVLLAGIGQVLGWTMSSLLFAIGPYGRFVGITLVVAYFGVLSARTANGQTLGKRLLKIAVRDRQNQPIGVGRSVLRIAVLAAPALLNGWDLPVLQSVVPQWCVGLIVFGLGSAIVYTLVFNRIARQGLHDVACGTYVVDLRRASTADFPSTPRVHLAVCGALVTVAALGGIVATYLATTGGLARLVTIHEGLRHDRRFFSVGVQDATFRAPERSFRSLEVHVWYRGVPGDGERAQVMGDVAREVLRSGGDMSQYDYLAVGLMSAYDLGIASGSTLYSEREPLSVWQQRVNGTVR